MINAIQLKVLLLDSITRVKFGSNNPLVDNSKNAVRREFKRLADLRPNAPEEEVLTALAATYEANDMLDEFINTMQKFGLGDWITVK